jgi:hypothetical protein
MKKSSLLGTVGSRILLFMFAGCLPLHHGVAIDETGQKPLATIDGSTLKLSDLEAELLSREGRQALDRLMDLQMEQLNWDAVPPDALLVQLHGNRAITRNALVANLLEQHGGKVRQELINILLVRKALERLNIEITPAVVDREIARQEQRLAEKLGDTRISLGDYIRAQEGKTLEQYRRSLSTQMAAGLHELVFQSSDIDELLLQDFFMENSQLFLHPAGRRLSIIHIAYVNPNDPDEQKGVATTMSTVYRSLADGTSDFKRWWQPFGRNARPQDTGGDAGWIARDGASPHPQTAAIPGDIMVDVFAVDLSKGPVLLPPYLRPNGAYIIRVEDERAEESGSYSELREQVREAYIMRHLSDLTKQTMRQLQAQANDVITIYPFAPLVAERRSQSHAWTPSKEQLDLLKLHAPTSPEPPTPQTASAANQTELDKKPTNSLNLFFLLALLGSSLLVGAIGFIAGKAVGASRQ